MCLNVANSRTTSPNVSSFSTGIPNHQPQCFLIFYRNSEPPNQGQTNGINNVFEIAGSDLEYYCKNE
jgi:hypothetical protein